MPAFASANSGTITKLRPGMKPVLKPLVRGDRGRHAQLRRAGELGCGLLAEGARQLRHPLEVGARRRIGARDEPDREPGDDRVDTRLEERDPDADAEDHGGLPAPGDRRVPERQQHREQADRDRERNERDCSVYTVAITTSATRSSTTASVSRRTRKRVPPGATSASTPSAKAVSVDMAAPQPSAPAPPALNAR